MATVTIHQAKTQLSKLIARAEAGEEIVIARDKQPVVRLTPVHATRHRRIPGVMKGVWPDLPDSFWFDPLPEEELQLWEGGGEDLLDSHSVVWFLTDSPRLSERARAAIVAEEASVFVSAASAWEIATKVRAGKWVEAEEIARDLETVLAEHDFIALPVTLAQGKLAGFLPGAHRDPFDRMLAAQAILEDMPLVTADPAFRAFDVKVVW